jgi:hypothetical protein
VTILTEKRVDRGQFLIGDIAPSWCNARSWTVVCVMSAPVRFCPIVLRWSPPRVALFYWVGDGRSAYQVDTGELCHGVCNAAVQYLEKKG